MPKQIAISKVQAFAEKVGLKQVILAAWDGELTHIVTWGRSTEDCDQAAMGGDKIKAALGWPENANCLPSRVKALTGEIATLQERIAELESELRASYQAYRSE